ncbi:MAG: DUF1289 domain-containing protein [Paraglaciecola sp.]|uniref:DUF1289 domain-containing protein n=1 Tax=Pseudomonadati TaxID=3379134 RepID=UPI00273D59A4|nr:DUF1289 domain-containing protein [Paraglaciecola sp.]MDP5030320.1 DUF1289 domain-containing protein [Paraglaciecola sp.]MDP5131513.1 DUF1289 domain-containing protein [Paraglaciecola sp.]
MKQIEIFEITSPCIGVCQSGPKGYCLGCFRSRDERLHWTKLEENVQSAIIKACALRKKRANQAKSKQAQSKEEQKQTDLFE